MSSYQTESSPVFLDSSTPW